MDICLCRVLGRVERIFLTLAPESGTAVTVLHRPLRAYWVGLLTSVTFLLVLCESKG